MKTFLMIMVGVVLCNDAAAGASEMELRIGDALAKRFHQLDANHDGVLSRDEAQGNRWLARKFDSLDADGDGRLTLEEMKSHMKDRARAKPQAGVPEQAADNAKIVRPVMNYCGFVNRRQARPSSLAMLKATDSPRLEEDCLHRSAAGASGARTLV